jgi:LuxR family maltose regulon positive regulatory protein
MKPKENNPGYTRPSNKFYPPHIDQSQSLLRTSLLTAKLPHNGHNKKVIVVEAQAGQGKTTLVSQFLEHNNNSSLWYQIGPEDSDPVLLLSSLLANLSNNLPGFNSPQLTTILNEGSVGPFDLTRCANILLKDLDLHLQDDIYFVFDDLHLIEYGALTNSLLDHIVDTSPPKVHFIFVSRKPLELKSKVLRNGSQIVYVNTTDLALDIGEIEELYNNVLNQDITRHDAEEIQKITNGWIMGIVLASHPISGRSRFWLDSSNATLSTSHRKGHMLDYFQEEIFDQIPRNLHDPFLELAFLQEIPADLATEITGIENFSQVLFEMSQANFFIYSLDDKQHVFRFHHFFQEFLQKQAESQLTTADIARIYNHEARYYLDRDMTEKALTCYKNGGDLETMEKILQEKGMGLIAKNRTITILTLLQSIPEETLFQYSWLTLYAGLLRVDFSPQTTLKFFNSARLHFIDTGEEAGELITLSQTIYFHFVISGQYNVGSKFLPRTEELLEKLKSNLPTPIIIMAARNLASGYCFFNGDMEKARHFIKMASTLATRHNIRNFIASTRFIQGYIELLSGNCAKYLIEAEICFSLFNDPLVGESNKLTMRVMHLCYLSMTGDHKNYSLQQELLKQSIDRKVVEQTVAAPYFFVWGSSNFFSAGQTEQGLELLNKGLGITSTSSTDHMHSQILQWQAFGSALTGKGKDAQDRLSESARLRNIAGGPFYIAFHNIIAGGVYTRLKMFDKAQDRLDKGLELARSIPSTFLTLCALMNTSYFKHESESPEAALKDLEAGLSLMKNSGYDHFGSWEPVMMTNLLALAAKENIEKDFAQSLARKRLGINFSDDGRSIPLLKFTLLDSFALSMGGKTLLHAKDFTPYQRELLGLLLTAKGQRIPQDRIQLELWPDNSPENARKSFDTLLNRLRKLLIPHLSGQVKDYLYLQKGILCLANYEIDALEFIETAKIGLSHSKNNDWLQAHNAFRTASSIYRGTLPEDTFKSEQSLAYNDRLTHIFAEFTTVWATNMAKTGRLEEAATLVEQILYINPLEEDLTQLLYRLYNQNNNPLKARDTLDRYRKALIKAEYTEEEITEFIDEIIMKQN